MVETLFALFIILHGLVHLLYLAQSYRWVELPGLAWPDASWAFSGWLGQQPTRLLGVVACGLVILVFVAGGAGIFLQQAWWRTLVVGASVLSTVVYLLLWDGKLAQLPDQGAIAILINVALVVAVLGLRWPAYAF